MDNGSRALLERSVVVELIIVLTPARETGEVIGDVDVGEETSLVEAALTTLEHSLIAGPSWCFSARTVLLLLLLLLLVVVRRTPTSTLSRPPAGSIGHNLSIPSHSTTGPSTSPLFLQRVRLLEVKPSSIVPRCVLRLMVSFPIML
jgi:hypothetical protein